MIHCPTQANPQIGRMCWSSGTTDHNQCSLECACNVTAHIKNWPLLVISMSCGNKDMTVVDRLQSMMH